MSGLYSKLHAYVRDQLDKNSESNESARDVQRKLGDDCQLSAVVCALHRSEENPIFSGKMDAILEQLAYDVDKSSVMNVIAELLKHLDSASKKEDRVRILLNAAQFNNHMFDAASIELLERPVTQARVEARAGTFADVLDEEINRRLNEYREEPLVIRSDYFTSFESWYRENAEHLTPNQLAVYLLARQKKVFHTLKEDMGLPPELKQMPIWKVESWLGMQEKFLPLLQESAETLRKLLAGKKIIEFLERVADMQDGSLDHSFKCSLVRCLKGPLGNVIVNLKKLCDEAFDKLQREQESLAQLQRAMASTDLMFLCNGATTDLVKLSKLVQVANERHESGKPLIALDQWLRVSLEGELSRCLEESVREQFSEFFQNLHERSYSNQDWLREIRFYLGNYTAFVAKRDGRKFDLSSTIAVTDLKKLVGFDPSVVSGDGESWRTATMPLCVQYQNKNGERVEQYDSLSGLKNLFSDLKGSHEPVSFEQLEKIRRTILAVTHEYEDKPLRSYSLWAPIYQIQAQLSRNHGLVVDFESMIKVVIQGLTPIEFSVELVVNLNLREIKARHDGDSSLRFMGAEAKLGEIAIGLDIVEEAGQYRFLFKSGCVDYTPEYFLQRVLGGGAKESLDSFYLAAFNGDNGKIRERLRSAIGCPDLPNACLWAKAGGHQEAIDYMASSSVGPALQGSGMWARRPVAAASVASASAVSRF